MVEEVTTCLENQCWNATPSALFADGQNKTQSRAASQASAGWVWIKLFSQRKRFSLNKGPPAPAPPPPVSLLFPPRLSLLWWNLKQRDPQNIPAESQKKAHACTDTHTHTHACARSHTHPCGGEGREVRLRSWEEAGLVVSGGRQVCPDPHGWRGEVTISRLHERWWRRVPLQKDKSCSIVDTFKEIQDSSLPCRHGRLASVRFLRGKKAGNPQTNTTVEARIRTRLRSFFITSHFVFIARPDNLLILFLRWAAADKSARPA